MSHPDDDRRNEPAKVYPASETRDCWVVEAPRGAVVAEHTRHFTGTGAQRQALEFAYEVFGGARLFVR